MTVSAAPVRSGRRLLGWALATGVLAFAWAWLLGRDLFVLAEARGTYLRDSTALAPRALARNPSAAARPHGAQVVG